MLKSTCVYNYILYLLLFSFYKGPGASYGNKAVFKIIKCNIRQNNTPYNINNKYNNV